MPSLCDAARSTVTGPARLGPRLWRASSQAWRRTTASAARPYPPAHRDLGRDLNEAQSQSVADADDDQTAMLALAWHLTCTLSDSHQRRSVASDADATQRCRPRQDRLRSRLWSLPSPILAAVGLQATVSPSLARAADAETAASSAVDAVASTVAAVAPSAADASPPPAVDLTAAATAVANAASALAGAIAQPASTVASRVSGPTSEAVLEPVLRPATARSGSLASLCCRRGIVQPWMAQPLVLIRQAALRMRVFQRLKTMRAWFTDNSQSTSSCHDDR